ncbi:hypothetical protein KORDIASMS9_01225 [Kordia sp. SMS9]|nr:hypothetical protein KORDIASMS9_01225 [Kordia sp. SMS9]
MKEKINIPGYFLLGMVCMFIGIILLSLSYNVPSLIVLISSVFIFMFGVVKNKKKS